MAIRVKDAASSAQRFTTRAQGAQVDYQTGVSNAGQAWATNTAAANDAYKAGVQQAITRDAFAKGVQKAGGAKYSANASGKGAERYSSGVGSAGSAWQTGVSKYLGVIASLTLPPRRPKGSPDNIQRVAMIATALRAAKIGA